MAKKDKNQKVQKPVQGLQTDVAQITATGRVIASRFDPCAVHCVVLRSVEHAMRPIATQIPRNAQEDR